MDPLRSAGLRRLLLVLLGLWVLLAPGLVLAKPRAKSPGQARGGGGGRGGGHKDRGQPWSGNTSRGRHHGKPPTGYSREISRKVSRARTPEEFLRVFFPADSIKALWTRMVNESVQNAWRAGRTETEAVDSDRPTFTERTADREMAEFRKEVDEVWCRKPRLVLIDMYEELDIKRGTEEVFPACMKVGRCGGSGCCGDERYQCVANETTRTNVTRRFLLITTKRPYGGGKEPRLFNHSVYNDTDCYCRERQRACSPEACTGPRRFNAASCSCECRRRCPKPFQLENSTCDCTCRAGDGGLCNKIKRSKRMMSPTECKCVLDGDCYQPPCKKGYEFAPTFCRCVQKHEYATRRDRDRDRERDRDRNREPCRSDDREDRQRTVPSRKSGRTIYGPDPLDQSQLLSSSDDDDGGDDRGDDDDDDDNSALLPSFSELEAGQSGQTSSGMADEELLVAGAESPVPAEDCGLDGSSCQQHQQQDQQQEDQQRQDQQQQQQQQQQKEQQQQQDGSAQGYGSGGGGDDD